MSHVIHRPRILRDCSRFPDWSSSITAHLAQQLRFRTDTSYDNEISGRSEYTLYVNFS